MNKTKKILVTTLSAVLLVALTIAGTLAYLTSKDTVVNTFTVGNVEIKLDEAKVDENGSKVETEERVEGNEYHLLPGHEYDKDPTVTVLAGSEKSYVRMLVTINKQKEIHGIKALRGDLSKIFTGFDDTNWEYIGNEVNDEHTERVYEFRHKKVVVKNSADTKLTPLFTGIELPGAIDNVNLAKLEGLEIKVEAQAIQADGFDDAAAAWVAFEGQLSN